jgi:4-hydroxybenzoate polyprenyltransferase
LSRLRGLVGATHALPTAAVTVFVTASAFAAGVGRRSLLLGAAILCGQASIGWANDYVDADRDRAVHRRDKPVATGEVSANAVGRAAAIALTLTVPLSLAVGWVSGAAHLVAVGSAWMYDLRLKQTVVSWAPYALSFGLLPVIIAGALPGAPRPQPWIVGVAACLGVAANFANTVGDAADDAQTGVRGLPQRIGPRASVTVAAMTMLLAALLLVVATDGAAASIVAAGFAVGALPVAMRTSERRHAAFGAVIAAAGAIVVAFVLVGGDYLTRR